MAFHTNTTVLLPPLLHRDKMEHLYQRTRLSVEAEEEAAMQVSQQLPLVVEMAGYTEAAEAAEVVRKDLTLALAEMGRRVLWSSQLIFN